MHAVSMISQRLMAHPESHGVAGLVRHQKTNAILKNVRVLEARERHRIFRSLTRRRIEGVSRSCQALGIHRVTKLCGLRSSQVSLRIFYLDSQPVPRPLKA
jgi:hypothetical protein